MTLFDLDSEMRAPLPQPFFLACVEGWGEVGSYFLVTP